MRTKLLKRIPLHRLMDLKIDYAFKQLFGSEKNKQFTVVFLNAILQRSEREEIKDISFANIEDGGETKEDKQSRLDILAVTNAGEWINIEIQFTNQYDMIKRSIYYWAGIYRRPLLKRMNYKELNPVIAINILNFDIFTQTDRFHTTFHLYEDQENFKLTNVMEFHFIEMSKLMSDWKADKLNPWNNVLARWLLMLGMVDHRNKHVYEDVFKELEGIAMKDDKLYSAFQNWEKLSSTEEEMIAYEARMKRIVDEEAAIREAKLREEAAREEGESKGEKKAMEAVARRLLEKGLDIEMIAEVTELEKERVIEIKEKT